MTRDEFLAALKEPLEIKYARWAKEAEECARRHAKLTALNITLDRLFADGYEEKWRTHIVRGVFTMSTLDYDEAMRRFDASSEEMQARFILYFVSAYNLYDHLID